MGCMGCRLSRIGLIGGWIMGACLTLGGSLCAGQTAPEASGEEDYLGIYGRAEATPGEADRTEPRDRSLDQVEPLQASEVFISVLSDNDSISHDPNTNTDKHYTNGLRFDVAWQPRWAREFARSSRLLWDQPAEQTQGSFGLALGHTLHTPNRIVNPQPVEGGRPWASRLFGSAYFQRSSFHVADHIGLDFGIIGEAAGGEFLQTLAHDFFDVDDPDGWETQVDNHPAIDLRVQRTWRVRTYPWGLVDPPPPDDPMLQRFGLRMEALPYIGGTVGSALRNAFAGTTLRFGVNLPEDFGPPRLRQPLIFRQPRVAAEWTAYAFVRAGANIVQYNHLLEGQTAANNSVESKTLVGELQVGFRIRYRWFVLAYSQTWWSDDFKGQNTGVNFGSYFIGGRMTF